MYILVSLNLDPVFAFMIISFFLARYWNSTIENQYDPLMREFEKKK